MQTWSSPVGAKYQITLPKAVRKAMGISRPGELVGFLVDGSKITLAKAEVAAQADSFTEEEWSRLVRMGKSAAKPRSTAARFMARHKRLTRR